MYIVRTLFIIMFALWSVSGFVVAQNSAVAAQGSGDMSREDTVSIGGESLLQQDVRVVRAYTPTVANAFKINEMPEDFEPDDATPLFNYELAGRAIVGAPEVVPLIPAKMADPPKEELDNSFVWGYLGNYTILGGGIEYNIVQNEDFALALGVTHESSWGDIPLQNDEDVDSDYNNSSAELMMRRFFDNKTFSIDMGFNHRAYRYYGFETLTKANTINDVNLFYPDGESDVGVPASQLMPDKKQNYTLFNVDASLLNSGGRGSATDYDLVLGFSNFGNKSDVSENHFNLHGDFNFSFGDIGMRFETALDHASVNTAANNDSPLYNFENRQFSLVQLNPSFVRRGDRSRLKMGMRIGAGFDDVHEDEFYLSPDVTLDLSVVEGVVGVSAGITGDIKPSFYKNIAIDNPYISPDLHVRPAFHGVRFFFGTHGNFSSRVSFSARMEYNAFTDEHFFVNRHFEGADGVDDGYNNLFGVQYDDGGLVRVSGELDIDFTDDFSVALRAQYDGWDLDVLEHAWHRPSSKLSLRSRYNLNEDIEIYGSLNLLGERKALINNETVNLDALFDLNVGANYTFRNDWLFFGEFRNMLAEKHYRWYGYPNHRINVRAGVGYRF
ncbi:TonB-dependent receptor [Marinilabiliaceae bacterium ANBcel2]|nr:TonB-dependent receptor [Marinilabiliaceae bacterium ANBcel2]